MKSLSQAFLLDNINDPVSIHTVTAVYLATGLSLHALECVGDSIRDTPKHHSVCGDWPKEAVRTDSVISVNHSGAVDGPVEMTVPMPRRRAEYEIISPSSRSGCPCYERRLHGPSYRRVGRRARERDHSSLQCGSVYCRDSQICLCADEARFRGDRCQRRLT